jgi:hypothetical protein
MKILLLNFLFGTIVLLAQFDRRALQWRGRWELQPRRVPRNRRRRQ